MAIFGDIGGSPCRRLKRGISAPSASAMSDTNLVTIKIQICQEFTFFATDNGSDRNMNYDIFAIPSITKLAFSVLTVSSEKMLAQLKLGEGFDIFARHKVDRTSMATIASIRTALRNRFLMPKSDGTIATLARTDSDMDMIKHMRNSYEKRLRRIPEALQTVTS